MSFFDRIKSKAENAFYNKRDVPEAAYELEPEKKLQREMRRYEDSFPEDYVNLLKLEKQLRRDFDEYSESNNDSEPSDAYVKLYLSEDKMTAFLCVFPPKYGGQEITIQAMQGDLMLEGITHGIDCGLLEQIVSQKQYMRIFVIAKGTAPVDGKDGEIVDCIERRGELNIQVGENKVVNFEMHNLFQRIKKGEAICKIVPPEQGVDGRNVVGRVLPSKNGASVAIPQGKHTVLSQDKSLLLAGINGDISFSNGVFSIENRFIIEGNLDSNSSKLEFSGDIIIGGDVSDGVMIITKGSVIIGGWVGDAVIKAGRHIYIQKGMNGNNHGTLEAMGEVQCKVMENLKVSAYGDVYSDLITKCDITAGGSVYIKGGKGMLVGGTIRAARAVEAKRIGNQSLVMNSIFIGYSPEKMLSVDTANKNLDDIEKTLEKIRITIKKLWGVPSLPPEKKETLHKLNQQEELYLIEKANLSQKRQELLEELMNEEECYVTAESILPLTIVNLLDKKLTIREGMENCKVCHLKNKLCVKKMK